MNMNVLQCTLLGFFSPPSVDRLCPLLYHSGYLSGIEYIDSEILRWHSL